MSPAGLTSLAFGFAGLAELPPQPARASTATRASPRNMGATVRPPGHRAVRRRSTPGQSCGVRIEARVTVGRVSRPGILVVEDDEAIASALSRVLDSQGYDVR